MTGGPDRTVIVTGGASGIGLATVRQLAACGWRVIAVDADGAALARLGSNQETSARIRGVQLDITDEEAVERLFERDLAEEAPVMGLVNSAGIGESSPFLDTDATRFRRIIEVNLTGTFLISRAAARRMIASGGGAIVNISSGSALRGNAGRAAYGASKGGVETLTKVMAVELAPMGIRVNAVAPGPVETPLVTQMHAGMRERVTASVPQGRYGQPEEIAAAILFLLGEGSTYVTGHTLCVDGGFYAAGAFNSGNPDAQDRNVP